MYPLIKINTTPSIIALTRLHPAFYWYCSVALIFFIMASLFTDIRTSYKEIIDNKRRQDAKAALHSPKDKKGKEIEKAKNAGRDEKEKFKDSVKGSSIREPNFEGLSNMIFTSLFQKITNWMRQI